MLYLASLLPDTGELTAPRMVPMQARKMRLHHASPADQQWLATILDRISRPHGSLIDLQPGGILLLRTRSRS